MQRTWEERARRRNLADAAAGIRRARVALYACTPAGERDAILARLRGFAEARDWDVAAEAVDHTDACEAADRPQRARLGELISSCQVQGIVVPDRTPSSPDPGEDAWLDDQRTSHYAFVARVRIPTTRPGDSGVRPTGEKST